jgi:4-carboxymuconolactone decarboxylase
MVRACADGRERRRQAQDHSGSAHRTHAEICAKDERAINDFVHELYKTKRVSDRTYKRLHTVLGDAAMVDLVGIIGYYVMISFTLNVFRMMPPEDAKLPFAEPK